MKKYFVSHFSCKVKHIRYEKIQLDHGVLEIYYLLQDLLYYKLMLKILQYSKFTKFSVLPESSFFSLNRYNMVLQSS